MTGPSDNQTKIVWDDAHERTTRADAWRVTGTREEIILVFGTNREPHDDREQESIDLTDRIVLSPFVAKRLAMALDMGIRHYESRYGPLQEQPRELSRNTRTSPSDGSPLPEQAERKDAGAEGLLRLVKALDVEVGFERSFKIFKETLLGNRFLVGMSKRAMGQTAHEKILDICERMNMPGDLLEAFKQHLADSDYVHFGFEENEKTCIYKAYLEFYEKIGREMKSRRHSRSGPCVLHLGFKWDLSDSAKHALATYTWYPSLSLKNMMERLSAMLDPLEHGTLLELAKGMLGIASRRIAPQDILYLEVTEQGSPRKSFDINMYRAGLQLGELYPFFVDMCRYYSIPFERFQRLYEPVKTRFFGHLSGGMDREERDFLTVYYGVEGIREFDALTGQREEKPLLGVKARTGIPSRSEASLAGVETTDEKAGLLFELVNRLEVKVGFERSFKVFANTFLPDRFLLGFRRKDLRQNPFQSIENICRHIDMPEDFLEAFQRHLPESNIVLFGFEGNETKRLYKAYLEFGDRITRVLDESQGRPKPFPIHMAFKWDVSDNSQKTAAEYICFPGFSLQDMLERLTAQFYPRRRKTPFKIVEGILHLASSKSDPGEFIYFEAEEPLNPRTSFDVNLYSANLQMKEIYPFLLDIVRHYSIPIERFHPFYDALGPQIFGHLTGGVDRQGRDFLTVYFGEKGSSGPGAGKR